MADIDLECDENNKSTWWIPIWNDINYFSGIFEGNNHEITNLYINSTKENSYITLSAGFFGTISNAEINNLSIINGYINMYRAPTGMLVGKIEGVSTYIRNCNIKRGEITTEGSGMVYGVGGIIGENISGICYIENCENSTKIISSSFAGGILGG